MLSWGRLGILAALIGACSTSETKVAPECGYHEDCLNGGVCFAGKCEATQTCFDRSGCSRVPVCAGDRCMCTEDTNRCVPVCVTDLDCAADGECLDGVCRRYPIDMSGSAAPTPSARGSLRAGVARVELDFPLGVSLAGYAARRGPKTPYMNALGGSNAWLDKPDVRAIAFDDGAEMFVFVRSPTCWVSDELLAATAAEVSRRTGVNLLDHLVIVATHSHSEPARFWHMVQGLDLGLFGYDEFSGEIFERITTSLADGVVAAMDAMQPARFGYKVLEDFDPDDRIHRDRRHRNNGLPNWLQKDDRLVLMRVDDESGSPIAIIVNMAMHSTVFDWDNPIITGDASAGVEVTATLGASEKWNKPVLAFYVNSSSGDISPAGDDAHHPPAEQLQLVGRRVWQVIEPALEQIETRADTALAIAGARVPITREALGYQEGEFHDTSVECENSPPFFRYGAFQCVEGRWDDADAATGFHDGELGCVFAVECMTGGYPIPQFQKTHLTAVKLGDLVWTTLPGEPVSQFGRNVSDRVRAAVPGANAVAIFGYAQDYHFYLLEPEDWFQGGYEPSRAIWGWKFAPYIADRAVELALELAKPAADRAPIGEGLKPMAWPLGAEELQRVQPTETDGAPERIIADVPERADRFELVAFSWAGGHPGVDRPHIVLEAETNGAFAPVMHPGGIEYDDSTFEMLVRYEGKCNRSTCTEHAWRVEWEEGRAFAPGRYRLRATGRALKSGAVADYVAVSRAFELVPTERLVLHDVVVSRAGIEGFVEDPPASPGAHLLRSEHAPAAIGGPLKAGDVLRARVTLSDGTAAAPIVIDGDATITAIEAHVRPGQETAYASSRFMIANTALEMVPSGRWNVELELEDAHQNRGTHAASAEW